MVKTVLLPILYNEKDQKPKEIFSSQSANMTITRNICLLFTCLEN